MDLTFSVGLEICSDDLKIFKTIPQLAFTCLNSSIQTLEKGVKYVQS